MSIGVQSYPELYTMLLGWDLYGKMWNLLTKTGIAYLPFIGMILKNMAQSYTTHGHEGAGIGLRQMEVNIIFTLLLILLGVAPFIPLNAHTVTYSPLCGNEQQNTYHPGATGTTYDKAFTLPNGDIHVPLWWYAVISVSSGITNAANHSIACVPNLRKMVTTINMTNITDPSVKEELQDFANMCYAPAKKQLLNDHQINNMSRLERINSNIKKHGEDDTEWLGSHAFNETYYRNIKATRAVPGFPYDNGNDINADANKINPPTFGTPSCYDWWNSTDHGLKKRVYAVLPDLFTREFRDFLKTEQDQDNIIRNIITRTPNYANGNDLSGDMSYSHIASALGIWYHQLSEYPKLYAAAQAAPIIQSLLLLMVYVFLPFGLAFSGYKPSSFVVGAVLIFSLIFWGFIWHLVSWTDYALMQALYSGWVAKQGAGASLADMVIGSLVVAAPLFWFMFMGSLGITAGNIVSSAVMGMNNIGESAANTGGKAVQGAAKAVGMAAL